MAEEHNVSEWHGDELTCRNLFSFCFLFCQSLLSPLCRLCHATPMETMSHNAEATNFSFFVGFQLFCFFRSSLSHLLLGPGLRLRAESDEMHTSRVLTQVNIATSYRIELSFLSLLIYSYTESYPTFVNEASQKFYLEFEKDKEHEVKNSVLCKFEYSHPTSLLSHIPILDLCMGKHKSNHNLTKKKHKEL